MSAKFKFNWGKGTSLLSNLIRVVAVVASLVGVLVIASVAHPSSNWAVDFAIRNRDWVPWFLGVVATLAAVAAVIQAVEIYRLFSYLRRHRRWWPRGSDGVYASGPLGNLPRPPKQRRTVRKYALLVSLVLLVFVIGYGMAAVSKSDTTDFLSMSETASCHFRDFPQNRKLILFVHGLFGDRDGTWEHFPQLVSEDPRLSGFNICAIDYQTYVSRRNLDIDGASWFILSQLETNWGDHGARKRYDQIFVIAHSMGGLVSRDIEYWDYSHHWPMEFDKIVEIATPHRGSPRVSGSKMSRLLAWFGYFPEVEDMQNDSGYLATLKSHWDAIEPRPTDYCIGSQTDEWVPPTSATYDCDPLESISYDGGLHTEVVKPTSRDDRRYSTPINLLLGLGVPVTMKTPGLTNHG